MPRRELSDNLRGRYSYSSDGGGTGSNQRDRYDIIQVPTVTTADTNWGTNGSVTWDIDNSESHTTWLIRDNDSGELREVIQDAAFLRSQTAFLAERSRLRNNPDAYPNVLFVNWLHLPQLIKLFRYFTSRHCEVQDLVHFEYANCRFVITTGQTRFARVSHAALFQLLHPGVEYPLPPDR